MRDSRHDDAATGKLVLGWAVGEQAVTALALEAWQQARETLTGLSLDPAGRIIHQDQDPVFTSYAWTRRLLIKDGCRVSYALQGAKDNGDKAPLDYARSLLEEGRASQR